jgi:hypothetical protein
MNFEKNPKIRAFAKRLLQLEDKINGKPFPEMARVHQITSSSCGPATLEMLFSFVGAKVSQTKIIKSVRAQKTIGKYGITIKDMAKATQIVGKRGLAFWYKHNATVNNILAAVNKFQHPVGVEWQGDFYENQDEDLGHYSVVTKVDKKSGSMRIADPYFNGFFLYKDLDRRYKISDFTKAWWDVNEVKVSGTSKRRRIKDTRVMFVVTKKGESWPKKLGMKKG